MQGSLFQQETIRIVTKVGECFTVGSRDLYVKTSDSSRDAAVAIRKPKRKLLAVVLDAIEQSQGLTDQEIERATGLGGSTARPRRRELEEAGYIRDSGIRRKTESGRQAVVWVRA